MKEKSDNEKVTKKKSFLAGLLEKLDKKMEEKAKSQSSCCNPKKENDSCCS